MTLAQGGLVGLGTQSGQVTRQAQVGGGKVGLTGLNGLESTAWGNLAVTGAELMQVKYKSLLGVASRPRLPGILRASSS